MIWRALAGVALVALGVWFFWGRITGTLDWERVGPKPSAGRQAVVLLHGYGAGCGDLVGLASELSAQLPETTFAVPCGPHRAGLGHAWYPDMTVATREEYVQRLEVELAATNAKLWKLIGALRAKGVACEDIYVGGFSQGARIAAQVALLEPEDCALGGLIVMSGGLIEVELPEGDAPALRALVSHGNGDSVVSMGAGLTIARTLAARGHAVRWLEFKGKHQIPDEVRDAVASFLQGEDVGAPPPR